MSLAPRVSRKPPPVVAQDLPLVVECTKCGEQYFDCEVAMSQAGEIIEMDCVCDKCGWWQGEVCIIDDEEDDYESFT